MNPIGIYMLAMEAVLIACTIIAAITAGWAAAGPAAGLIIWTLTLVGFWPLFKEEL